MKKFKTKKKFRLKKILIIFIMLFVIYEILSSIFLNVRLTSSNEQFLKFLLNDSNYYKLYIKNNDNIINKLIKTITNMDLKSPTSILETTFNYKVNRTEPVMYSNTTDSDNKEEKTDSVYIEDPNKNTTSKEPLVYIYNTHQLESYNKSIYEDYNITPNVMMTSYMIREQLNKKNIPTIVETGNMKDFLNLNNWDYSYSYAASRYYLKNTLKKYKNLKLIIDIHRDSVSKDLSTVTINNKKYAKVLFVVGLEHKNYNKNLDTANKLNNIIKKKYPTLSRGIIKKEGKNVNGIYNQDLNANVVLIECGGKDNKIEEVMNTVLLLTDAIDEYIGE